MVFGLFKKKKNQPKAKGAPDVPSKDQATSQPQGTTTTESSAAQVGGAQVEVI